MYPKDRWCLQCRDSMGTAAEELLCFSCCNSGPCKLLPGHLSGTLHSKGFHNNVAVWHESAGRRTLNVNGGHTGARSLLASDLLH